MIADLWRALFGTRPLRRRWALATILGAAVAGVLWWSGLLAWMPTVQQVGAHICVGLLVALLVVAAAPPPGRRYRPKH